jgi:hypothetical protein
MTEIARRVLIAADAETDADMARLALQALGLDGPRKSDRNVNALREALEDLGRRFTRAYPGEDDEESPDTRPLESVIAVGVATWLYGHVKAEREHDPEKEGGDPSAEKQLNRYAEHDPSLREMLDWALSLEPEDRGSRGRVR